jgi:hypothetical protein
MLFIDDNDWILNTLQYHIPMLYKQIATELIESRNNSKFKQAGPLFGVGLFSGQSCLITYEYLVRELGAHVRLLLID